LPGVITAADYERAEGMLGSATRDLVIGGSVRAAWLSDGRFSFRATTADGTAFVLSGPERRSRPAAFDQAAVALALSEARDTTYNPSELPFQAFEFLDDGRAIGFQMGAARWRCELAGNNCTSERGNGRPAAGRNMILSPDGKRAAFI